MKLYELRRALQEALDGFAPGDEERELSSADVDRLERRVLAAMIRASVAAKSRASKRARGRN